MNKVNAKTTNNENELLSNDNLLQLLQLFYSFNEIIGSNSAIRKLDKTMFTIVDSQIFNERTSEEMQEQIRFLIEMKNWISKLSPIWNRFHQEYKEKHTEREGHNIYHKKKDLCILEM